MSHGELKATAKDTGSCFPLSGHYQEAMSVHTASEFSTPILSKKKWFSACVDPGGTLWMLSAGTAVNPTEPWRPFTSWAHRGHAMLDEWGQPLAFITPITWAVSAMHPRCRGCTKKPQHEGGGAESLAGGCPVLLVGQRCGSGSSKSPVVLLWLERGHWGSPSAAEAGGKRWRDGACTLSHQSSLLLFCH